MRPLCCDDPEATIPDSENYDEFLAAYNTNRLPPWHVSMRSILFYSTKKHSNHHFEVNIVFLQRSSAFFLIPFEIRFPIRIRHI